MAKVNVEMLTEKSSELANDITSLQLANNPDLLKRYGAAGKRRCYKDAEYHLKYLIEALTMERPDMYANYILWASAMLKARHLTEKDLEDNLDVVQQSIHNIMGPQFSSVTKHYISAAKEKLKDQSDESQSCITENNPLKQEVTTYLEYLLQGKRHEATLFISELIDQGIEIKAIYQHIFQVSQYEVGRLWQLNKITVAHEHYCTAATQLIISGLYKHIYATNRKGKTLVACSISGELHELGIRMVSDFFEMDGWDTYYLGANIPDRQLIEALSEHKADVLALSVSLPIHVSKAATLIKTIRRNKNLSNLKIMVGGCPFLKNDNLWQNVAADAFAKNAQQAITKANELVTQ